MDVLRRPKFVDDLSDAYTYLAEQNPRAADHLLDEVEDLIALLSAFPELGRVRNELHQGVRSFWVRQFRYILFYRLSEDSIVLLRLLHGARDIAPDLVTG